MGHIYFLLSALWLTFSPQGFASAGDEDEIARQIACDNACSVKLREDNEKCFVAQKARFQSNKADPGHAYRLCMRQATEESLRCFEKCLGIDTPRASH